MSNVSNEKLNDNNTTCFVISVKNPKVDNYSEFVISLVLGDEITSNVVQPNKTMSNVSSENR